MWYNSTSNVWKVEEVTTVGSWASGGNMGTARYGLAGAGTQTEALAFGGYLPGATNATEEYNGTSWSGGGNLPVAKYSPGGCGTQTAGLSFGGSDPSSPASPVIAYNCRI
jgi:hypothetical protein